MEDETKNVILRNLKNVFIDMQEAANKAVENNDYEVAIDILNVLEMLLEEMKY